MDFCLVSDALQGNLESASDSCRRCEKADVPCYPQPLTKIRIKAVHSVVEQSRTSDQGGREIYFDYDENHVWVDFVKPGRLCVHIGTSIPLTSR